MLVKIGKYNMEMGGPYLTELRSSNDIQDDFDALRKRMQEDGYILLREFHDRNQVLKARSEIVQKLMERGRLAPGTDPKEAILREDNKGANLMGANKDMPEFLSVVNSPKVMTFFSEFLGGEVLTYDYKWLRGVPREGFTGAHYDIVYMGRGTKNLYTMWTPFGDIPIKMGTLSVLLGSHRWDKLRETYGNMDVDRDGTDGWFSTDPMEMVEKYGGQWATTNFEAGDMIFFGMFTMHGSTVNETDRMRISCDTRYQLKDDLVDERWIGRMRGHQPDPDKKPKSMKEARAEWGLE